VIIIQVHAAPDTKTPGHEVPQGRFASPPRNFNFLLLTLNFDFLLILRIIIRNLRLPFPESFAIFNDYNLSMKTSSLLVLLVFLIFFVISFLTNILGPIIPGIINSFDLKLGLAGFLPFSFFAAYGVMSIPAGLMIEKYSEKKVLIVAFLLSTIGGLFFGLIPVFSVALISLFLIGIGMAMLQVVINPLLRQAGGEEKFAFNSVMGQLFFGAASFLSPKLYSYLEANLHTNNNSPVFSVFNKLVSADLKWVSVYWIFAGISATMIIVVAFIRFPTIILREDEKIQTGRAFRDLLSNRYVILFFVGIFCYVGTEQGIANWASQFLQQYHQVDPTKEGADVIANFWLMLTLGCVIGLLLLKFIDSRKVLIFFSAGAIASLALALTGSKDAAVLAFPAAGFFASVMWSVIVSLALNSVPHHHGTFAGVLCTGIAGGAVIPLIIGATADFTGLRSAMIILFITLGYILCIGFWANPLVNNNVVSLKEFFGIRKVTP
jgi:fucose permease